MPLKLYNVTITVFSTPLHQRKECRNSKVDKSTGLALHIKSKGGLPLPSGGVLTVRGLLLLGRHFGFHGGLDTVHNLILRMKTDLSQFQFITRPTLIAVENALTFDDIVLYAVLHEAIYCEGAASNWAAERVGKTLREFQWLTGTPQSAAAVREQPLYFAGEMIYPFMFDNSPELEKLGAVADVIAKYTDWPKLYDEWQLARNEVPLYAATFVDDMVGDSWLESPRFLHTHERESAVFILSHLILHSSLVSLGA
jgi:hypothetical protein